MSIIGGVTIGVTVVYTLAILFLGMFFVGGAAAWANVMREFGWEIPSVANSVLTALFVGFALLAVAVAATGFAAGIGMLRGLEWARVLVVALLMLNALGGLVSLLQAEWNGAVGVAVSALVVWYLHQPDVRAWFRRERIMRP